MLFKGENNYINMFGIAENTVENKNIYFNIHIIVKSVM